MMRIVSRAEWGAKTPKSTPVRMAVVPSVLVYVHHTAGSERGAAGMRSIQAFHQSTRRFNDIGYSFVIDGDDGVIYEGRGAGVRGGHVLGDENEHHGICLMGNYENEHLTDAARRSLVDLLRYGREQGWWQLNVRGHRQSPTAQTACPGAHLFAALPSIHQAAASPATTPATDPVPAPKEDEMRIIDCQGSPALLVRGDGTYENLNNDERNAWRAGGVEAHLVTKAQRDIITAAAPTASTSPSADAIADAIVAKLPAGSPDAAVIKGVLREVFAEAKTVGHFELADPS